MLTDARLEHILQRIPTLTIGVAGDLFLDRYLDIDDALTEPSIETGLDAYQVVRVRSYPGAAGTVVNNLAALGVGHVCVVSIIGDDGEGHELRQALARLRVVDTRWLVNGVGRRTPTYTKPMLEEKGRPARELNRLDIKNRSVISAELASAIEKALDETWPRVDALLVADQVSEEDCGVITRAIRDRLARLGEADPSKLLLVDSRERIGQFRSVWLKPNQAECARAVANLGIGESCTSAQAEENAMRLARQTGRPVFCTCGELGIDVVDPHNQAYMRTRVPAYPVQGPIDIVGAGDSTSAAIASAVAAGANLAEAAAFGCLIASITIQQIGTTGTATPRQIRERWAQVRARA